MSARYTGGLVYNAPGGWSGQFNGSNQYLEVADNAAFQLGTGDFTLEAWVNMNAVPTSGNYYIVAGKYSSTANCYYFQIYNNSGTVQLIIGGSTGSVTANYTFSAATWYHLAAVRNGATTSLYINGTSVASGTFSDNAVASGIPYRIGVIQSTVSSTFLGYFNGYISNNRLVKGTAVYTSNFTPSIGALQPITNTSILTCRYPTFADGSSNAFSITNVNGAVVSTVNPFPTSQLPNPALGGAGNGVYTMSQYAALKAANLWPAYDPYYKNVTLNLHGNGTNAAQNNTFLDSSTNNFTITRNGNTTQGTFTPYGSTWSNYFNGSSTYLSFASNAAFAVTTTADYTVEGWINFATVANGGVFQTTSNPTSATGPLWFGYYSGNLTVAQHGSATYNVSYAWTPTAGVWYHVAATRTSGTVRLFINGALVATDASTQNGVAFTQSGAAIGLVTTPSYLTGYLSNVRFVNGTSLYTAAFTPSTGSLTAVTNTVVLSCQSNRFIDNSSNNFAITANGSPSVQRFSPFSPTSAYSTSVIGGSGYFDGTGDYLVVPDNTAFDLAASDWTFETWVNFSVVPASGGAATFASQWRSSSSISYGWFFYLFNNAGTYQLYLTYSTTGTNQSNLFVNLSSAPTNATWNHVAFVRSGTNFLVFWNGVQVGSTQTLNATIFNSTTDVWVGAQNAGGSPDYLLNGYLSNLRLVKGTAVYTSNFTPPTAPLTAITNTSLLLSYTNAGILDNAMMNDLETVGNAQISTSVKKYGTGSMYFDGSGDVLTSIYTPNLNISSGSFTLEAWVYYSTATTYFHILSMWDSGNLMYQLYVNTASNFVNFNTSSNGSSSTGDLQSANGSVTANTWTHIAVVRNGSTTTLYINGTSAVSNTNAIYNGSSKLGIGGRVDGAFYATGYIDDLRITKGVARYTANFTPPTSQLQDQ